MINKFLNVSDKGKKILLTVSYIVAISILQHLNASCIFLRFLNIPCPGCGMTRAFMSLINFDLIGAFNNHLMFWSVPILYLYFWFDGHLFNKKGIDKTILLTILLGFIVNWIKSIFFCWPGWFKVLIYFCESYSQMF